MGKNNIKKTTEQFKKEVFDLVGDSYSVIGDYVNAKTKIEMKHNVCGYEYEIIPSKFTSSGRRCSKCQGTYRRTHEEFVDEVKSITGTEYSVVGKFTNTQNKVKMRHNECKYEWDIIASGFLVGRRCPKCMGGISISNEDFIDRVYKLVGEEYSILENYINNHSKIELKHNKCGYTYKVKPGNFITLGRRCPNCYGSKKKSTDIFKQEVFELVKNEYEVLGTYSNNKAKIKFKHTVCNTEYTVAPIAFLRGSRCPTCYKKHKKSTEQFKKEVFELVENEYSVLGEYRNSNTKICMKHNICNNEWDVSPDAFLRGNGCPVCAGNIRKSKDQFEKEIISLTGLEYLVLSEYENNKVKVKFKHTICDHIFTMTPISFIRGSRCPKCNESKGEKIISIWLDSNSIQYKTQYKFNDCRNKRRLPFDFAIFNDCGNLQCLIEFDGEQHFIPARFSKDKEVMLQKLIDVQLRDAIKNEYCLKNEIKLLRIPYWEFNNIESILEKEINKPKIEQKV